MRLLQGALTRTCSGRSSETLDWPLTAFPASDFKSSRLLRSTSLHLVHSPLSSRLEHQAFVLRFTHRTLFVQAILDHASKLLYL